ncbi:Uncharacterised protein [Mycobacteroides abscessus subsp. abscessus]|nr:Uncharacterised protein [Mycobacteroides abscessus subsp. abscessus]
MIGLVQDADLDTVQCQVALLEQVVQPARACDHNVHSGLDRLDLPMLRNPAEDGGDFHPVGGRQRLDDGTDLGGQFASGGQHERARPARHARAVGDSRDHGDRKTEGLAATGLAARQHVAAAESIRQGGRLDREGRVDTAPSQDVDKGCRHPE